MDKHTRHFEYEKQWFKLVIKDFSLWEDKTINESHFYHQRHQHLYTFLSSIQARGEVLTPLTWQTLTHTQKAQFGDISELTAYDEKPTLENLKAIEREMQTYHIGQSMIGSVAPLVKQDRFELENLREIGQQINEVMDNVGTRRKSFNELIMQTHEKWMNMSDALSGVPTGYTSLNSAFDGFQQGDLIICAARPSMGKTAITVNWLLKSVQSDPHVMSSYFPAETGDESILKRSVAILGSLPVNCMRNPMKYLSENQKEIYNKTMSKLTHMNINIDDTGDIREIRQIARERTRKYPNHKHLFIIDHLGHLFDGNVYQSRNLEYESYCKQLKAVAKDFNVSVILLSQLSRGVEQRENKRPMNSDLRDSGSIEQIADIIMMLYRDSYYTDEEKDVDEIEVIITKNRDGALGTFTYPFIKQTNEVREMS